MRCLAIGFGSGVGSWAEQWSEHDRDDATSANDS